METLLIFYVHMQLQVSLDKVIYSRLLESCEKSAGNIWLYKFTKSNFNRYQICI